MISLMRNRASLISCVCMKKRQSYRRIQKNRFDILFFLFSLTLFTGCLGKDTNDNTASGLGKNSLTRSSCNVEHHNLAMNQEIAQCMDTDKALLFEEIQTLSLDLKKSYDKIEILDKEILDYKATQFHLEINEQKLSKNLAQFENKCTMLNNKLHESRDHVLNHKKKANYVYTEFLQMREDWSSLIDSLKEKMDMFSKNIQVIMPEKTTRKDQKNPPTDWSASENESYQGKSRTSSRRTKKNSKRGLNSPLTPLTPLLGNAKNSDALMSQSPVRNMYSAQQSVAGFKIYVDTQDQKNPDEDWSASEDELNLEKTKTPNTISNESSRKVPRSPFGAKFGNNPISESRVPLSPYDANSYSQVSMDI